MTHCSNNEKEQKKNKIMTVSVSRREDVDTYMLLLFDLSGKDGLSVLKYQ